MQSCCAATPGTGQWWRVRSTRRWVRTMTVLQTALPGSAETWRTDPPAAPVPPELIPTRTGSWVERLAAWHRRHLLRERRAEAYYAASRNPERGLPVADRGVVRTFFADLARTRRGAVTLLLVLHALAALAGLIVPRLLGSIVDATTRSGTLAGTLDGIALAVVAVVVTQAVLTFCALRMSVVVGNE